MTEQDLVLIRTALEKPTVTQAISAMENTLKELGYKSPEEVEAEVEELWYLKWMMIRLLI